MGLFWVFLFMTLTEAKVSLKTLSTVVAFRDIGFSEGLELRVERFYHSRSGHLGIFGWGWGSPYETRVLPFPDGNLRVREYGSGQTIRFVPRGYSPSALEPDIDRIVKHALKSGTLSESFTAEDLVKKLKNDPKFLESEWERAARGRVIEPKKTQPGIDYISAVRPGQIVRKTQTGYVRFFPNRSSQTFDKAGRLIEIRDSQDSYVQLIYDPKRLKQARDSMGRTLVFTYTSKGRVASVLASDGRKAEYQYNDQEDLVTASTAKNQVTHFSYSLDRRHNLGEIKFPDGTTEKMIYSQKSQGENLIQFKERNGIVREYQKEEDPTRRDHEILKTLVRSPKGKVIYQSSLETFYQNVPDQGRFILRTVETLREKKVETFYNQAGLTTAVRDNGKEITWSYDDLGRIAKKVTPAEVIELTYDPANGKTAQVRRTPKNQQGSSLVTEFQYDPAGNLVLARNTRNEMVKVIYGKSGKPIAMLDAHQRRLDLKYNELGLPVEIKDPESGTLTIVYDSHGNEKKISSVGSQAAREIDRFYRSMRKLLDEASVD